MKTIVNVCLTGPYSDHFSYQDNILPKYQCRLGYRVVIFAPTWQWGKDGNLEHVKPGYYLDAEGVEVVRIDNDQNKPVSYRFKTYGKLTELLNEFSPNIIFLHCPQLRDASTIASYVQSNRSVELFVDNHADYSNSGQNKISRYILHRLIWRHYIRKLEPLTERFWGVLPSRVDYLVDNYGLPSEKCDLLVMGADDDEVSRASNPTVRAATRESLGFGKDDFLVVTGGKIDHAKTQTLLLMDAVRSMGEHVKLLVFGPVAPEIRNEFERRLDSEKIIHVPWANTSESYDYFAAADAICFPGRHSVYWEQAVAMGKPLIVKRWPGTEHVDVCGNAMFLDEDSTEAIVTMLDKILLGNGPSSNQLNNATRSFLYSDIAKRSIGIK